MKAILTIIAAISAQLAVAHCKFDLGYSLSRCFIDLPVDTFPDLVMDGMPRNSYDANAHLLCHVQVQPLSYVFSLEVPVSATVS